VTARAPHPGDTVRGTHDDATRSSETAMPTSTFHFLMRPLPLAAAIALAGMTLAPQPAHALPQPPASPDAQNTMSIVAVVNGDVISREDVINRRRLFALSTGMPATPEVLDRLTPQVVRQLIDERLRLQEVQKRKIVVSDQDIAEAVHEVEARNGMQPGALRKRLSADGVGFRTLVDQMRVQIGWSRLLHQQIGEQAQVSAADIAERKKLIVAQTGQPEYRVGEILVTISDPTHSDEARRFADTVIQQLRAGAPFPIVAAQFSQSQTALQGGDMGWVQPNELDPAVLRVLNEMPVGAISNPIPVPGGLSIVSLRGKREIGRDPATMMTMRQVFFPFPTRLDPQNPTPAQQQAMEQARKLSTTASGCEAMDAANTALGSKRPADPGEIRLESIGIAPLRAVLASLPVGKASQPLVAEDGIAVVMVCSREQKDVGMPSDKELAERLLNERTELVSRQLMRDLQRRAVIDQRS
jgi:peptidyl-prolyl cis-trans isomerase SurA